MTNGGVWITKRAKEPRKARKCFVTFAAFRGFRDPKAYESTAARGTARVREIEAEIDGLTAKLWGFSEQELEEIQRSLEKLE